MKNIRTMLRNERKLRRQTQREIAEYVGVTSAVINRFERGHSEMLFSRVVKYAEAMGLEFILSIKDVSNND